MSAQVLSFEGDRFQDLPPQNIEAEEAILGGILLDPEAIDRVIEVLKPDDFYVNAHRLIYVSCLDLHCRNQPCDLLQVTNELNDRGQLTAVGGKGKLAQLLDRTVSSINIDAMAQIVADKAISRRMIAVGNEIQRLGWNQSEDLDERLDAAEQKVFALRQERSTLTTNKSDELICESVRVFQKFEQNAQSGSISVATGFYDLDKLLGGGFKSGHLIVIGGRPSMGKSLLGCNIAYEVAARTKKHTLIFSLEMEIDEIITRFYSNLTGIDSDRLNQGNISITEWERLAQAMDTLSRTSMTIDHTPITNAGAIRSKIRSKIALHKEVKLVVIDYLQLLIGDEDVNLANKIGKITRQLKLIARECQVPIILLSQLNRKLEDRNEKRPKLADLRDSGRIEEDADVVLLPYRDEYYNPDTPDRGLMEVICAKQRGGKTGSIKLLCDTTFSRIQNYAGK